MLKCRTLLEDEAGRIHIFSICAACSDRLMQHATESYKADREGPPDRSAAVIFLPTAPPKEPWRAEIMQGSVEPDDAATPAATEDTGGRINPFDDD
jgi:hypothetical protein